MTETIGFIGGDPSEDPELLASLRAVHPHYDANYRRWLPSDRGAAILDYGCGAGAMLRYLDGLGYTDVTGFDLDSRYAAFCRAHSRAKMVQSADALGFLRAQAQKFDLVIATHVVYYFPREGLQEWFTALAATVRPGGSLIVEVINGAGLAGAWPYRNDLYIQNVFSESLLRVLLERSGLTLVDLRDEIVPPGGLKRALWKVGRRAWALVLHTIYVLERGVDERNPRFFGKSLIAVARRGSTSTRP